MSDLIETYNIQSEQARNYADVHALINYQIKQVIKSNWDLSKGGCFDIEGGILFNRFASFRYLDLDWMFEESNEEFVRNFLKSLSDSNIHSLNFDQFINGGEFFNKFIAAIPRIKVKEVVNQLPMSGVITLFIKIYCSNSELEPLNEFWKNNFSYDLKAEKDLFKDLFLDNDNSLKDQFLNYFLYTLQATQKHPLPIYKRLEKLQQLSQNSDLNNLNSSQRPYSDEFVYQLFLRFLQDLPYTAENFNRLQNTGHLPYRFENFEEMLRTVLLSACSYDVDHVMDFISLCEPIAPLSSPYVSSNLQHDAYQEKHGYYPQSRWAPLSAGTTQLSHTKSARK